MRHGNQRFSDADDVILTDRYLDPRQSGFTRRQEGHGLIVRTCEAAEALNELPLELQVLLDATPRTIARQRPQLLLLANLYDARCRRNYHAEQRSGELEKLLLPVFAQRPNSGDCCVASHFRLRSGVRWR